MKGAELVEKPNDRSHWRRIMCVQIPGSAMPRHILSQLKIRTSGSYHRALLLDIAGRLHCTELHHIGQ